MSTRRPLCAKSCHCQVYAEPHHVDDVELIGLNKLSDGSCRLDRRAFAAFVGTGRYCLGAYCISPLPNDQFSGKTSTRLMKTSCLRTSALVWRSSAILR